MSMDLGVSMDRKKSGDALVAALADQVGAEVKAELLPIFQAAVKEIVAASRLGAPAVNVAAPNVSAPNVTVKPTINVDVPESATEMAGVETALAKISGQLTDIAKLLAQPVTTTVHRDPQRQIDSTVQKRGK